MSCVFQNIDPPTPSPPLSPRNKGGGYTLPGQRGGWGALFWKTQDTALYSTYIESSLAHIV
jgi:hypothetical protein